ncbi:hypothetical protein RND81_03G027600 [Saponaria officinalis]|uniref:Reverse transcriptase zinc-binding domain-containing protein n=1 Tax=Saponaria officinalis TaxID=3572 RepID=A0AAW1M4Z5_SAPOF
MLASLGFEEGHFPFRYLGIPLNSSRLTSSMFQPLLHKLRCSISHWSSMFLSYTGRSQLINSVVFGIENFWFSSLLIPLGIMRQLNGFCKRFLWQAMEGQRKMVFKSWSSSCRPRDEGGFGIKEVFAWNKPLLLRWVCWLHFSRHNIWCRWVQAYLLRHEDVWSVQPRHNSPGSWHGILRVRDDFVSRAGSVSSATSLLISWYMADRFDVSSAYDFFRDKSRPVFWAKTVWYSLNIPRHSYISALAAQAKLATVDNICIRGLSIPNRCILCKAAAKNHQHLFFQCPVSHAVWGAILSWLRLPVRRWSLMRELRWFRVHIWERHWSSTWSRCALTATIYTVWAERNFRTFKDAERSVDCLVRAVKFFVSVRMLGFSSSLFYDEIVDCLNS